MVKSIKLDTTRGRAKQDKPAAKKAVAKKPAAKKPTSISLEKAIPELEREVKRIAELESEPMLRAILAGRIILTADEIADSIEKGFLEGKVIYDSNGAPDPAQSSIAAIEMPRFLDFIRRSLEETKMELIKQSDEQDDPARENDRQVGGILGFYSIMEEWPYWAGKPTLVADEAIPLMNGLDPRSWRNRDKRMRPEQPLPDDMVSAITRGLKIAEADGSKAKNPTDWLVWGRSHGLDKPTMKTDHRLREPDICMWPLFARAVAEVESKAKEAGTNTAGKEVDTNTEKPNADYDPILQKLAEEEAGKLQAAGEDNKKESVATKVAKRLDKEEAYKHYRHLSNQAIERRIRRTWKLNRAVKLRP